VRRLCAVVVLLCATALGAPADDETALPDAPLPGARTPRITAGSDPATGVLGTMPRPALRFAVSSRTCAAGWVTANDCGVHWAPLLRQSFTLLMLQHGARLAGDASARTAMTRGPFFSKWFDAAGQQQLTRWNDGDAFVTNYVGHPLMGGVASFLFIQNDPRGRDLTVHNSRQYWTSRLKAMAFTAAYTVQWEIGPLSEASLAHTGSAQYRSRHSGRMTNGTGLVDYIVTPLGGTAVTVAEDLIDRHLLWGLEGRTNNRAALLGMSLLNPTRSAANLLRGRAPWYRDGRFKRVARTDLPFQNAAE